MAVGEKKEGRLLYGARKYVAFSLLVSRWVRLEVARPGNYIYVTLGGTEMRDIRSLHFIDPALVARCFTFEADRERLVIAQSEHTALTRAGIDVTISGASLFEYERSGIAPHIFYIDLLGIFAFADYDITIGKMFQREIIKEGDCLLITSHLAHRPGPDRIRTAFSGELSVLDATEPTSVAQLFRRAHPSFTLFKALTRYRLAQELNVRCFGCVKYSDTSPMGIYGYVIGSGKTELRQLVNAETIPYFDANTMSACMPEDF